MKMLTDAHMTTCMDMYTTRQMDRHQLCKNNLAQVVSYNPGFKSLGGSVFELESGKHNMDKYMYVRTQKTGKQTDTNFKNNLDGVLSPC